MKTAIDKIAVGPRIRVDNGDIEAFADNINRNGLINPITVMRTDGGELKLLAGYRRLLAVQVLGWTEIDVNIMSPFDAEEALLIEIAENEQRKGFAVAEIDKYGYLLEEIEKEKAKIRKAEGQALGGAIAGKGRPKNDNSFEDPGPQSYGGSQERNPQTRDYVARKFNMSGRQYERVKYIAANAPQELIEQIDRGERTIRQTYDELRAVEKDVAPPAQDIPEKIPKPMPAPKPQAEGPAYKPPARHRNEKKDPYLEELEAQQSEAVSKLMEFDALPPEGKIAELQRQLKEARARARSAESDLAREKELRKNVEYHMGGTIELLKSQLAAAETRIAELEEDAALRAAGN